MPEVGTYGSMSGDGKRGDAAWPKLPRPSSTLPFRSNVSAGLELPYVSVCSPDEISQSHRLRHHLMKQLKPLKPQPPGGIYSGPSDIATRKGWPRCGVPK